MTDKLVVLSAIENRLARIEHIDEAKDIRDKAEAIRRYAKSAKLGLGIQNRAALIKILAEQKAGDLCKAVERAQGSRNGKDGLRGTLTRSQIPWEMARRWQTMANVAGFMQSRCINLFPH